MELIRLSPRRSDLDVLLVDAEKGAMKVCARRMVYPRRGVPIRGSIRWKCRVGEIPNQVEEPLLETNVAIQLRIQIGRVEKPRNPFGHRRAAWWRVLTEPYQCYGRQLDRLQHEISGAVSKPGSPRAFYSRDALLLQIMSLPTLLDEAWRLEPFRPPFSFSAFFSPEDTLLCVCAADAARRLLTESAPKRKADSDFTVAELTSGSGLVGLSILRQTKNARLLGLDVDREAANVAERNAILLDLDSRTRFTSSDLWSTTTLHMLEKEKPRLIICNPPYVPEPPSTRMQIEAGAGPHGTAHLLRALELTRLVQPDALALSWCSLSDPAGIVAAADGSGYDLKTLYVSAIAEGEYSGSVHSYLRELSDCFINEQPETLAAVAPDASASFSFLLFSGAFIRREARSASGKDSASAAAVEKICSDFASGGIRTLESATAPFALHCSMLTRWDELELRVLLHGDKAPPPEPA
jgi:hypothetical protein